MGCCLWKIVCKGHRKGKVGESGLECLIIILNHRINKQQPYLPSGYIKAFDCRHTPNFICKALQMHYLINLQSAPGKIWGREVGEKSIQESPGEEVLIRPNCGWWAWRWISHFCQHKSLWPGVTHTNEGAVQLGGNAGTGARAIGTSCENSRVVHKIA